MLKLIGKRRLPPGTAAAVADLRNAHEMALSWRDVVQVCDDYLQDHCAKHLDMFLPVFPACANQSPAFILFRDVCEHTDDWGRVSHNGRYVAPAFVHWVMHGRACINVGGKRLSVGRGDIFAMDMNKRHGIESSSLCITACVTVPRCTI